MSSAKRTWLGRSPLRRGAADHALPRILCATVLALLSSVGTSPVAAQGVSASASEQQMQGLDEQVQEIKSDVLSIAAELSLLEEQLLHPSNTQVAIFVSLAEGEDFRLDWVKLQIDGGPVAHHIYSFKELEALRKGGVQRIYTGNLPTGVHRLEVSMAGKLSGGADLSATEGFDFTKKVGPKLVGLTLVGQGSGQVGIRLGDS
jgi:hypothetical protein